ncbi:hypothetical protein JM83_1907 [Gillisia sp. Hel_I_86]|uniref:DUF6563 family protein n=1 Tax=Gillisia sp. Hel_I_86 TaxID=1249981 RepID=UPI0011993B41|nr:DUF6563 family protein [Gillisia sp. Hel_I_86]TVZ26908.1 hypothetical protein JM83_1907 [Gillisia sp. Hel_I_86]
MSISATSQEIYPQGSYMSLEELKAKTPSKNFDLTIERRTKSDIKMNGGNNYKLISADKSIKRKVLKKEIVAHSTGDSIFINGWPYKLQTWYSKIISDGKYFVFTAGIPMNKTMQTKEMQSGMAFGAIGGGSAGASLAMKRFLYLLDKETNKIRMIDREVMTELLTEYPELLDEYNLEREKDEIPTQIEYLKIWLCFIKLWNYQFLILPFDRAIEFYCTDVLGDAPCKFQAL